MPPPFAALTPRQLDIIRELAANRTLAEAARRLGLRDDVAKADALVICTVLQVESPAAAGRAWRAYHSPAGRMKRAGRWASGAARQRGIVSVAAVLAGLALAAVAVMLALVPVADDDRDALLRPVAPGTPPAGSGSPVATPTPVQLTSQVDRAIRAVVDADYLAFRALLVNLPEPCSSDPAGRNAPPRCPAGVPDGGTVETFRYQDCERGYPQDLDATFRSVLAAGYRLYSASLSVGPARPAFLPGGDYRLVFIAPTGAALSLEVTLGGIISAWLGCGLGPGAMVAGIPTTAFIVQPPGQRVTGAPWVNP